MNKLIISFALTISLTAFLIVGPAKANTEFHTVQLGDTLWKIATKYNVTVDELKNANALVSDTIRLDQKLNISMQTSTTPKVQIPVKSSITAFQAGKKVTLPAPEKVFSKPVANIFTTPTKPLSGSSQDTFDKVIELSHALLDTPYKWAGVTADGFDCSGFIYYVYKEAGLDVKRFDTIALHANSINVEEPVPGDLLFFENTYRSGISHAGIYIGDGQFIHAGSKKVEISSIKSGYWKDKFTESKRLNSFLK
ncbi:C40 family peptidase [Sporosarcina siberiensis]|uniref:C40 family peptidase n=1 Tax=Sporosarcina siberiensis TaxID=1365606 RepID=A0ABW4SCY4_9BACL